MFVEYGRTNKGDEMKDIIRFGNSEKQAMSQIRYWFENSLWMSITETLSQFDIERVRSFNENHDKYQW